MTKGKTERLDSEKPKPKAKLAPVKLLVAYWGADGARCEANSIIELATKDAKKMIADGKAERADPMPGED